MAAIPSQTEWNSPGTLVSGQGCYKDVTFTSCAIGDLLVVIGVSENYTMSAGTSNISTISGLTGTWTSRTPATITFLEDCDVIGGWAVANSSGTIVVRVRVRNTVAEWMGVLGYCVPSADVGPFYGWSTDIGPSDADMLVSLTLTEAASTVISTWGDWTAQDPLDATPEPYASEIEHVRETFSNRYSVGSISWSNQLAGTRSYGLLGLAGGDGTGVTFVMAEAELVETLSQKTLYRQQLAGKSLASVYRKTASGIQAVSAYRV